MTEEGKGKQTVLNVFIPSHIVFLNVFPLLIFPWDPDACGMCKVLVKPSQCTSQPHVDKSFNLSKLLDFG